MKFTIFLCWQRKKNPHQIYFDDEKSAKATSTAWCIIYSNLNWTKIIAKFETFWEREKKNMYVYTLSQTRLWIEHIKSYDDHIKKIKINKYPWWKNDLKMKREKKRFVPETMAKTSMRWFGARFLIIWWLR